MGGISHYIESRSISETVFQSNLHLAHRFGGRDHAERGWCLRIGGWCVPVRMISQVERLQPDFERSRGAEASLVERTMERDVRGAGHPAETRVT